MANDTVTPMMRQYQDNKARHPDAILLFRMGDFYEMFFEDAKKAAKILDIALTTRDKNKEDGVPMCGFPHHAASAYISKLLSAGERVAVCDQIEDPRKAKGIVKREITRVLTPGLTEEPGTLKVNENHYLAALAVKGNEFGIAAFDLSTGDFLVTKVNDMDLVCRELKRLDPKELLVPERLGENHPIREQISDMFYLHEIEDWMTDFKSCVDVLRDQYNVQSLDGFGLSEPTLIVAAGAVLNYVRQSRYEAPTHIREPKVYHLGNYMVLDPGTIRNLEIFKNLKDGSASGSLINLLDDTSTPMGARLLRQWVSYPLLEPKEISKRADTIQAFCENGISRADLRELLKKVGDIERIAGKISLKSVLPRDLVQLRSSIEQLPSILGLLTDIDTELSQEIRGIDDLSYVAHAIAAVIVDSPPPTIRDGGVIREGYNSELDDLRDIRLHGKEWIAQIEERERKNTGISNLRVSYNKVFGYYIEITKSQLEKVPLNFVRKQTLVNAERFITEELKDYEFKVLNAQDRILELELEIFDLLRTKLIEVIPRLQQAARAIATLDVVTSLAEIAAKRGYSRPEVNATDEISIIEGRHPVVETFDTLETYVPNDVVLNRTSDQILIITGPNMAGKSTYMRQVALMVIMAQIGGFIPASKASIGVVDRIFTRIGAADYLAFGQSTFMVEMNETADILHNATDRSLVLLDEIGRGTSTFDGLSIAWAVTEHLHDRPGGGPRTMFATHYHELIDVALVKERVKNYTIAVREWKDRIIFLRKIVPGGTNRSYGIQVAKLAGIPEAVITRAREILENLEKEEIDPKGKPKLSRKRHEKKKAPQEIMQIEMFRSPADDLVAELQALDVNTVTPIEALNRLADWKKRFV